MCLTKWFKQEITINNQSYYCGFGKVIRYIIVPNFVKCATQICEFIQKKGQKDKFVFFYLCYHIIGLIIISLKLNFSDIIKFWSGSTQIILVFKATNTRAESVYLIYSAKVSNIFNASLGGKNIAGGTPYSWFVDDRTIFISSSGQP